jgi:glycosyltransferase involved in cell wall biosynthesis
VSAIGKHWLNQNMLEQAMTPQSERSHEKAAYRFGFVLTTAAGNQTRYLNLRKYADRDASIECVWAPVSHHIEGNPYGRLPRMLQSRAIVSKQAEAVMKQLSRLDAVMFHAFEPYAITSIRSLFHRSPSIVWSQDNPPIPKPGSHPQSNYGKEHERPAWRQRLRYRFDQWCAGRTTLFLPFSSWAAEVLTQDCGIPPSRVHPLHVGLDLETWPYVPRDQAADSRPGRLLNILFVGGDFERKGGSQLLEVFASEFSDRASLTLVTGGAPSQLPKNTTVHSGVKPNDPLLRQLYAECDVFVLPTIADMSSWAALEAMATGRPVIISGVGGIPELIEGGITGFLISAGNREMLIDRLRILIGNPELRHSMGQAGRKRVESYFDARQCVPSIIQLMKRSVDLSRTTS